MEDLFETFSQGNTRGRSKKKRLMNQKTSRDSLAGYSLQEAMGGELFQSSHTDSSWFDLDHEIASKTGRKSESEELDFEPGFLEEVEGGDRGY